MSFGPNVKRERVPAKGRRVTQHTPPSPASNTKSFMGNEDNERSQRRYALDTSFYHWEVIKSWKQPEAALPEPLPTRLLELDAENRSFIHQVIPEFASEEAPQIALEYVEAIVLEKPGLFINKDKSGKLPMIEAARFQSPILFRVLDLLVPTYILSLLAKKCHLEQQSCPLHKVAQGRLKQSRKGKPSTSRSKLTTDKPFAVEDMVCLHGRIDIRMLQEKDRELRGALHSSLKENPEILHHIFKVDKFDKKSPQCIPLASFKILVELLSDKNFVPQQPEGLAPLQEAIKLFGQDSIDYELLFEVIKASVNKCPQSIFIKGGGVRGPTACQILEDKRTQQNAEWLVKAQDLLKKICVGAKKIYDQDKKDWISENIRDKKNEFLYSHAPLGKCFHSCDDLIP
ncbi:hypothetical protein H9Q69_011133 [Fusarium xylarioides]|uniref:Uncharacterized protein n=1 Tax=Fusarium xylarioides TaxID=221167 RepID=A0A9P7HN20_9HYPO|nr:hypothetical protein H9Q72_011874 [Fusarium xylarioides]KAG5789818.1 hypothetical protein H9Q69_011133 [Fusarium xylarioides]